MKAHEIHKPAGKSVWMGSELTKLTEWVFEQPPRDVPRYAFVPGDIQFVNNRTMMHGSAHFEDHAEKEKRRHLLRLWLSMDEWPAMAPLQTMHSDAIKLKWQDTAAVRKLIH